VKWYYGWSPRAAAWLRRHAIARKLTRAVLWIPVGFAWLSLRTNVALALFGVLVLLLSSGWSLRRGPVWWRVLCLLILAMGIASAQIPHWKPSLKPISPIRISVSVKVLRSQSREETARQTSLPRNIRHSLLVQRHWTRWPSRGHGAADGGAAPALITPICMELRN
jgi:hypothetical protein